MYAINILLLILYQELIKIKNILMTHSNIVGYRFYFQIENCICSLTILQLNLNRIQLINTK